jgi:hypothetical protein
LCTVATMYSRDDVQLDPRLNYHPSLSLHLRVKRKQQQQSGKCVSDYEIC